MAFTHCYICSVCVFFVNASHLVDTETNIGILKLESATMKIAGGDSNSGNSGVANQIVPELQHLLLASFLLLPCDILITHALCYYK